MSDKTVDQIYDIHKKLRDAGESIGAETQLFTELIAATHSTDTAVKTLVATELPKYVHLFPTLAEQALTAQMDLLEDEQTAIRIRAIRGVELICRHSPQRTRTQGELIGQLLTAEASELSAVKLTLTALFSIDAKETFSALFTQLTQNDQPLRVNATEFIVQQMARLKADTIAKSEDLQKHLGEEIKKVLLSDQILTSDEMKSWLQHLRELKAVAKDANYGTDIGNILIKHAGLDKSFDPNAEQQINQYLTALTLAGGYSKSGLDNGPFLTYFSTRIVPVFDTLTPAHKTDLLKAVSLATRFATPKTARALLPGIVDLLNGLIPRPGDKAATAAASDVKEEKDAAFQHKINFSFVECLLYAYHQLAKLAPDTVREVSGIFIPTGQPGDFSGDASKREAFIARLTHVNEQAKAFETQVSEHLKTQIKDKIKTASEDEKKVLSEKSKIAMISIRTVQSIQRMVQPLLGKEPQFISARLSWQSIPKGKGKGDGTKAGGTASSTKGQGTKRKAGNQAASQKQGGQQGGQTGSKKKQKGQPQQQQQQQQPAQNKKRKNDGGSGSNKKQRTNQDQSASSAPSYSGQPGETIVKREKPARGGSASQKRGGGRGGGQQSQSQSQSRAGSQKKQQNSGNGGGFRNATPQRGGGGGRGRGGRGRGRGGRGGRGRGRG